MSEQATRIATEQNALTDEEVVARVLAGDLALFEVLMRRYNQRVYRTVRSILSNSDEAEDVVQDAYVRAYTHLAQFEGRSSFSTWLTRIAVHEAFARNRKQQRLVAFEAMEEQEGEMSFITSTSRTPEEETLARSVSSMLESAVDSLPPAYRSVFMLREIEGLSTTEAAECLDLTEDAVKVRLHRGRAMLRREIFNRTGEASASAFQFAGARCDAIVASVLARIEALRASG
jgi:RNA polymerase sigma-70 factor (ECF subfamily)